MFRTEKFSSIDLQSAYHQVRLKSEDIPKTAFTTPVGLFEYTVLCSGLTNAPATFQSVMNDSLQGMLGKFVLVYLDDIIVFSQTEEEHLMHLDIVMRVEQKHILFAKLSNAHLHRLSCCFLGGLWAVNHGCLGSESDDVWLIQKGFLGFADYFKKFIIGFAALMQPLRRICKESVQYDRIAECQKCFDGVNDVLCNAPVVAPPNPSNALRWAATPTRRASGLCCSRSAVILHLRGRRPLMLSQDIILVSKNSLVLCMHWNCGGAACKVQISQL